MELHINAFQRLKPSCIALGEVVLKAESATLDTIQVRKALQKLLDALKTVVEKQAALDDKLIEYVFFPLSHVFRRAQTLSSELLELALRSLHILLLNGWTLSPDPRLGIQLLILLTYLSGGSSHTRGSVAKRNTDELQALAYECLAILFRSLGRLPSRDQTFLHTENIPAVGHAVNTILEGVRHSLEPRVQINALSALQSFQDHVADRSVTATFFPGIVSALSHVLTLKTSSRRQYKLLERSTSLLQTFLCLMLADEPMALDVLTFGKAKDSDTTLQKLNSAWYTATAMQVNLVLVNVVKLRRHDRQEVRDAIFSLCIAVLKQCRESMSQSASLMVDTIIDLASSASDTQKLDQLRRLAFLDEALAANIRSGLYDRINSLSRVVLSADGDSKNSTLRQTLVSARLVIEMGLDMTPLKPILQSTLQEAVLGVIRTSRRTNTTVNANTLMMQNSVSLVSMDISHGFPTTAGNMVFASIFSDHEKSQNSTMQNLQNLMQEFGKSNTTVDLLQDTLDVARCSQDEIMLVNLWMSLRLAQTHYPGNSELFDLLDLEVADGAFTDLFDELYAFALSILSRSAESIQVEWRIEALALEVVAFQAQRLQKQFRVELVDSLYPVVHALGSKTPELYNHAITCLNLIASHCGYSDVKSLLVGNADYLINAVGVKLSTFDLSPEAPQVLLMLVKICGHSLIPHINDLIDDIFAALECFHGYPSLVELLLSTLSGIVEEGAKSPQFELLTIENGASGIVSHRKAEFRPTTMKHLQILIKDQIRLEASRQTRDDLESHSAAPEILWKDTKALKEDIPGEEGDDPSTELETKNLEVKLSRTYTILKRIVTFTQYHLPSSSSSIRSSLLQLLFTAMPYLSAHDDSFLPLVHLLWPVLIPRLEDKEAYIVSNVLAVIGTICEGAGDFVSSRVDALWSRICSIHEGIESCSGPTETSLLKPASSLFQVTKLGKMSQVSIRSTGPEEALIVATKQSVQSTATYAFAYVPTTTHIIRKALTSFLVQLVSNVRISEEIFTAILQDMLYDPLIVHKQADVRTVLEGKNPDAVWLLFEQVKWSQERISQMSKEDWWRRQPVDIEGAPKFVKFVC